jgi:hypothetical protein
MEKEVDKTLERNGKKEYCNILKLFGLGHLMSIILFFRVWLWNQEIARLYGKKNNKKYAQTNK